MSLHKEEARRYTNYTNDDGEVIVSIDEHRGEVIIYDEDVDEPREIWRPETGWTR